MWDCCIAFVVLLVAGRALFALAARAMNDARLGR